MPSTLLDPFCVICNTFSTWFILRNTMTRPISVLANDKIHFYDCLIINPAGTCTTISLSIHSKCVCRLVMFLGYCEPCHNRLGWLAEVHKATYTIFTFQDHSLLIPQCRVSSSLKMLVHVFSLGKYSRDRTYRKKKDLSGEAQDLIKQRNKLCIFSDDPGLG